MQPLLEPSPKETPKHRKEKRVPVLIVKRGSFEIKIFRVPKRAHGVEYQQFEFTYCAYNGARQKPVRRSSLEESKREAEIIATKLANGESEVLKLTSLDRAVYLQAQDSLRLLDSPPPLNLAVADYVASIKRLPKGTSLLQAVDFYSRRSPAGFPQKTVREVVNELVAVREGRSAGDLKDLDGRGGRFADSFQVPLSQVTGTMIEDYLDGLNLGPRTVRNHLGVITRIFRFAVRRKYLAKDALEELEVIELPEEIESEIAIFTPSELREILDAARPEIIPWLCVAALSGVRSAEIQRLDWNNINFAERYIEVPAKKAKTRSRRLAHLPDNAVAWLQPRVKKEGRIAEFDNMAKQILKLVQDLNLARKARAETEGSPFKEFVWRRNALRHSFISYRVAEIKAVDQVALEAGNSPDMIFRNYRKVVSEAEAAKWFAIRPAQEDNILVIPSAVAGQRRHSFACST